MTGIGLWCTPVSWPRGARILLLCALLGAVALLGGHRVAAADTIFSDGFETALAGWTTGDSATWYSGDPRNGAYSVQFRQRGTIERTIPTDGCTGLTVSFALAGYSLDNASEVVSASWYDGFTWTTLKTIRGGDSENDGRLRTYTYALPPSANDNPSFALRFQLDAKQGNDYGYVDDVLVQGQPGPSTLTLTGVGRGSVRVNGTLRSLPWSGEFAHGSAVTLEAVPDSGWEFSAWSGDATGASASIVVTMNTRRSIAATFAQLQYTLSLSKVGSGVVTVNGTPRALPWSGQFLSGASVTLEANPDSGWQFTGWSGDATWSGATLTVTMGAPKTIVATFSQESYTLSLAKAGCGSVKVDGIVRSLPWSGQFLSGTSVALEAVPDTGWQFTGWSGDRTWSGRALGITMDGARSLVASFSQNSYTLSLSKVGLGTVRVDGAAHTLPWSDLLLSGTTVTLQAVPESGWRFVGWSGDVTWSGSTLTVTMDAGKSIVATYRENIETLSIAKLGEGSVRVDGTLHSLPWSGTFATNAAVSLEAVPDSAWRFTGWSGDANWSGRTLTVTMSEEKNLTASFAERDSFFLSLSSTGSGTVQLDGTALSLPWSGELPRGSTVTLAATPIAGWQFVGWSGDLSGDDSPVQITIDRDYDVAAAFEQIPCLLSIDASGAGAVAVSGVAHSLPWSGEVPYGTEVSLVAVPDAGWQFDHWAGDIAGSDNPSSFVIVADTAVTAVFTQPADFVLSLSKYGTGSVTLDGEEIPLPWSGALPNGAEVTLTAVPGPAQVFVEWTGDVTGTTAAITLTMDSDKSLVARFGLAEGPFPDVPADYWAAEAVSAVRGAGLVIGFPDGNYYPLIKVTRAAMAVYLARALSGGLDSVPPGPDEATFTDVPSDHWAYKEIEYIAAESVAQGYGAGLYEPTWQVTRAQMAVFIARSIATPTGDEGLASYTPPSDPSFSDVPADMWCYRHVEYLAAAGVIVGYPEGDYKPTQTVTRDQMAVYVARAFGLIAR